MLDAILGIGELLLSWRLYLGIAVTAIVCWAIVALVPEPTTQLAVCIPIGITGLVYSLRWQLSADEDK